MTWWDVTISGPRVFLLSHNYVTLFPQLDASYIHALRLLIYECGQCWSPARFIIVHFLGNSLEENAPSSQSPREHSLD